MKALVTQRFLIGLEQIRETCMCIVVEKEIWSEVRYLCSGKYNQTIKETKTVTCSSPILYITGLSFFILVTEIFFLYLFYDSFFLVMSRHFCRALHFFRLIKYPSSLRGIWCSHHMPWCQSEYASWDFWEASFENMQRCNCSHGTTWLYEVKFNVSAWQMLSIWKISSLAQLVFHEITIKPYYFKSIVFMEGTFI
jgi:hypothetical protein